MHWPLRRSPAAPKKILDGGRLEAVESHGGSQAAGVERKRRLTRSPLLFLDRRCLCVFWGFWVLEEIYLAIIFMLYSRIASGAKVPRQLFSPQRA